MFGFSKPAPAADHESDDEGSRRPGHRVSEDHFRVQDYHDAYHQGDYERALRASESLRVKGKVTPEYCLAQGLVLLQLGRFAESEAWLRQNIEAEARPQHLARGHAALGQTLMQSKKFDEAIKAFARGLELSPKKGSLRRDMAEAMLRRGDDPATALTLARQAVAADSHPESGNVPDASQAHLGEDLATLAWILAAAEGDESEVEHHIQRAVPMVRHESVATTAQVHYHSGLAFATLGDRGRSMRFFEEAVLMDPKGLWGRGARIMAHGMSRG